MAPVLSGVRVVDISTTPAGAITTMCLADQGADVVRVIAPAGAASRGGPEALIWGRGKRSTVLDLESRTGRASLEDLVSTSDVLVESFTPTRRERLGLGYDALERSNARLIVCSISGYGSHGSWRDRPPIDALVQARTGMQFEQAGRRDGPIFLRVPLPSYGASLLASCAVNAALFARCITGRGQWVATSLFQGMQLMTVLAMSRVEHPPPDYYAHYACPRIGITPCVEGADNEWFHPMPDATALVLETLGESLESLPGEWRGDCDKVIPFHAALASLYRRLPRDEWLSLLRERDLRCQPVLSVDQAFDHDQVQHNGVIVTLDARGEGPLEQVAPPYRLEHHEASLRPESVDPIGIDDAVAWFTRPRHGDAVGVAPRALRNALEGIVVLDLGLALAGPFGPMLLSDLGADVIRVDNVVAPRGINDQIWAGCQRGKRSIALDLKSPEGRELVYRLIAAADVVHHNMRPGAAERLGIGYEDVKKINPRIVYCHVTGFGETGPLAGEGGCDQMAQALTGLEHDQGATDAGGAPTWLRFGMCDHVGAVASVVGVLQALYAREHSGEGQLVSANLLDAGLFLQSDAVRRPGDARVQARTELDEQQMGLSPLYRLYRTSDGWLCVACLEEPEWIELCKAVDRPELASDPRFGTHERRVERGGPLETELEQAFATRTAREWFEILDAHGVPCEVASETFIDAWYDDPDVVANEFVARYDHPVWGLTEQMGSLFGLSGTPSRVAGPPVIPGQHGMEILRGLGCSEDEIADLVQRSVTVIPDLA